MDLKITVLKKQQRASIFAAAELYLPGPSRQAQDARSWIRDGGIDAGGVISAGVRPAPVTCLIGSTLKAFTRSFPEVGDGAGC